MAGTVSALARFGCMREAIALTAIGSAALLTLAVAGAATLRHATELSAKEQRQLNNSINRIVIEQVARRDDVFPAAAAKAAASQATGLASPTTGTAAVDVTQLPPGPEARKEAARQNRDPVERAEREARAATARPAKKRPPPQAAAFRPDRVLPQAFLSIRKLAFDVLR